MPPRVSSSVLVPLRPFRDIRGALQVRLEGYKEGDCACQAGLLPTRTLFLVCHVLICDALLESCGQWLPQVTCTRQIHNFCSDERVSLGVTLSTLSRRSGGMVWPVRDRDAVRVGSVAELFFVTVWRAHSPWGDQVSVQGVLGVVRGIFTPNAIVGEWISIPPLVYVCLHDARRRVVSVYAEVRQSEWPQPPSQWYTVSLWRCPKWCRHKGQCGLEVLASFHVNFVAKNEVEALSLVRSTSWIVPLRVCARSG